MLGCPANLPSAAPFCRLSQGTSVHVSAGIATELRVLISGLCRLALCPVQLVLLLGVSYIFGPLDLIPDRTPIIGHFDEIGFLMAGFVGSRYLIPRQNEDRYLDLWTTRLKLSVRPGPWQRLQFLLQIAQADVSNFFLYQYRDVDAFLITGKNSGTHWLKFMLSCARQAVSRAAASALQRQRGRCHHQPPTVAEVRARAAHR